VTKASSARVNRRIEQDHRMVHKLIKKTAQEMAGIFYEWQATQRRYGDEFYKVYPNVEAFMKRDWPNFVRAAKECLVTQLNDPSVSDRDKEDIYEAMTLDATLPYSQQEVQITNFKH
jgi:hypothetical protein